MELKKDNVSGYNYKYERGSGTIPLITYSGSPHG